MKKAVKNIIDVQNSDHILYAYNWDGRIMIRPFTVIYVKLPLPRWGRGWGEGCSGRPKTVPPILLEPAPTEYIQIIYTNFPYLYVIL